MSSAIRRADIPVRPTAPKLDFPATAPPSANPVPQLIERGIVLTEEWEELPQEVREELLKLSRREAVLDALVRRHLLTRYQCDLIAQDRMGDLILGHYRILDPLGRGGMGTVYRAEHRYLRRPVAVKVMANCYRDNSRIINRFLMEARTVSRLQHPNIVTCLDAGRSEPLEGEGEPREYYVMDLVPGSDLQAIVAASGPLAIHRAANLFRQTAEAIAEAHRVGLVHRDIKPSNILVTPDWRAKLLDFGLARHPARSMTEPGTVLGTVGYMAPEQASDPSHVDGRADIFSLGATLFYALTGVEPFRTTGAVFSDLNRRLTARPPKVRRHRPEVPAELDDLLTKMMEPDPDKRFPSAAAAASALVPFTRLGLSGGSHPGVPVRRRILIVDDDPDVRVYIRSLLDPQYDCIEASDGREGLGYLDTERFDLVVVDHEMPRLDGARLIAKMEHSHDSSPMVLYMSGRVPTESLGGLLLAGADDFIRKPFTAPEFLSRVRGLINRRVVLPNTAYVEDSQLGKSSEILVTSIDPLGLLALGACRILEEIGSHSRGYHGRISQYVQVLGEAAARDKSYAALADPNLMGLLRIAAPAHDVGMTVIPASIIAKPGRLDPEERLAVQEHVTVGHRLISGLMTNYPTATGLDLAAEIARRHHERWDGEGYPDGLRGDAIPIAARVVGLVSTYDALRSRRPYRPGLSHPRAVRVIMTETQGQFDPILMAAFAENAEHFDRIYQSST